MTPEKPRLDGEWVSVPRAALLDCADAVAIVPHAGNTTIRGNCELIAATLRKLATTDEIHAASPDVLPRAQRVDGTEGLARTQATTSPPHEPAQEGGAPKDGTWFLGTFTDGETRRVSWGISRRDEKCWCTPTWYYYERELKSWQPLPASHARTIEALRAELATAQASERERCDAAIAASRMAGGNTASTYVAGWNGALAEASNRIRALSPTPNQEKPE